MSIRYISVASGSSGNCHYIEKSKTKILVDAGLSGKKIEEHLRQHHVDLATLGGIMVTHEHSDHIKGVGIISRRYDVPVFATLKTWESMENCLGKIKPENKRVFTPYESFSIGDIEINPFSTSHDAVDSCGFAISDGKNKLSIATDLGCVTDKVMEYISHSELVILESNHDEQMLKMGSYPYYLKQRVLSEFGHLSNADAGDVAAKLAKLGTKAVLLAHLSQENNMPVLAYQTVASIMEEQGVYANKDMDLMVLERSRVSDIFII